MLADSAIWGHRETFHLQTVSPLPLITLIIIVNIEEDINYLNGMDFGTGPFQLDIYIIYLTFIFSLFSARARL